MGGNIDKLSYFGYSFQIKVIASLFTDKNFIQKVSDILDPTYFESEQMQWIVTEILKYYGEYKEAPTLEVMKVKLSEIDDESTKTMVKETLKDAYRNLESNDLKFIKDEALDFCKNQELKKAILKSVDLLKNSKYDSIKSIIDNALKAGADTNLGHDYAEDVDLRYAESARSVKSMPWDIINDITEGGFGKGELIILAAGPGGGKCIGPKTKVEIEYEELGFSFIDSANNEHVIWFKPYDIIKVDSMELFGWEIETLFLQENAILEEGKLT